MTCARCGKDASHIHIGALESSDAALCGMCLMAWREINEQVRLTFVENLKKVQAEFLSIRQIKPDAPPVAIEEPEDVNLDFFAHAPAPPAATPEELPEIVFSEEEMMSAGDIDLGGNI